MDGAMGPTSATAATGSVLEAVPDLKTRIALYVWDFSFLLFLAVSLQILNALIHEIHNFVPFNVLYRHSQD